MNGHDDAVSVGLSAADIAWPIVLAMCIALMVLPFVFLLVGRSEEDPDDPAELTPARRQLAERDLPGIGKAYSLETLDGARLLAVVHQTLAARPLRHAAGAEEPTASVALSDEQAREFGAALRARSTSRRRSSRSRRSSTGSSSTG